MGTFLQDVRFGFRALTNRLASPPCYPDARGTHRRDYCNVQPGEWHSAEVTAVSRDRPDCQRRLCGSGFNSPHERWSRRIPRLSERSRTFENIGLYSDESVNITPPRPPKRYYARRSCLKHKNWRKRPPNRQVCWMQWVSCTTKSPMVAVSPIVLVTPLFAFVAVGVTSLIGLTIGIILPLSVFMFVVQAILPAPLVIGVAVVAALVPILVSIPVLVTVAVLIPLMFLVVSVPALVLLRRGLKQPTASKDQSECQQPFCRPHRRSSDGSSVRK